MYDECKVSVGFKHECLNDGGALSRATNLKNHLVIDRIRSVNVQPTAPRRPLLQYTKSVIIVTFIALLPSMNTTKQKCYYTRLRKYISYTLAFI